MTEPLQLIISIVFTTFCVHTKILYEREIKIRNKEEKR